MSSALIAVSVLGVASFGVGSAAPVDKTMNLGNQVSSMTVLPPTNVAATLSLNVLPPSCTSQITWTASPSSVDTYELRRVIASTGVVMGGPWSVAGNVLAYTDQNVALALPVNTAEWQVRALVGSWPSDWAAAIVDNPVLCLLGAPANAAPVSADPALDDQLLDDQLLDDELLDDELLDEVLSGDGFSGDELVDDQLIEGDDGDPVLLVGHHLIDVDEEL